MSDLTSDFEHNDRNRNGVCDRTAESCRSYDGIPSGTDGGDFPTIPHAIGEPLVHQLPHDPTKTRPYLKHGDESPARYGNC